MSSFIFNGHNSEELGLMVTQPIIRPSWAAEYNELTAAGGIRKVMQKMNTFGNASFSIETYLDDASQENIRKVYGALSGSGKLVVSTAPDEYLDVIISPISPVPAAFLAAEISVQLTARPFAYAVSPTIVDLTGAASYAEIENKGTVFSAPEIRLKGSGDVTINVNGAEFIIKIPSDLNSKEIIIDCDSQVAYYMDGNSMISVTHRTYNNFPLLHEGKNYVKYDGTVSEMKCNVRERWY